MEPSLAPFRPNTDIGQNFLVDFSVLERIIDAAGICDEDILLEIGAGNGTLTRRLLDCNPALLYAFEIDRRLKPFLEPLAMNPKLVLIWGDVLKNRFTESLNPSPQKLVANLPYHITTPVLWKVLEELVPAGLRSMVLMIQKEAADRLIPRSTGKNRSPLGITLERMGVATRLFDVPPSAFRPSPKVNSSVISIHLNDHFDLALDALWRNLLRQSFAQRRKTLFNNLKGWLSNSSPEKENPLEKLGLHSRIRAEELTIGDWENLMAEMKKGDL